MIIKLIKKISMSFFIIYLFNNIGTYFNIIIPMNISTLTVVYLYDFIGLVILISLSIVLF